MVAVHDVCGKTHVRYVDAFTVDLEAKVRFPLQPVENIDEAVVNRSPQRIDMETYADHFDGHDAVLIACFGDPGLLALREIATVPVVGLAQSSFMAAAARGRFAVVTGAKLWDAILYRFVRSHQLEAHLAGIHTVELTGMQIAAAPEQALDMLAAAAARGVAEGAQWIVLGGAAMGGLAPHLQVRVTVPVLDNIALAAQAVQDIVANPQPPFVRAGIPYALLGAGAALTRLMLKPCG